MKSITRARRVEAKLVDGTGMSSMTITFCISIVRIALVAVLVCRRYGLSPFWPYTCSTILRACALRTWLSPPLFTCIKPTARRCCVLFYCGELAIERFCRLCRWRPEETKDGATELQQQVLFRATLLLWRRRRKPDPGRFVRSQNRQIRPPQVCCIFIIYRR